MSDSDAARAEALKSPLGKAFLRLLDDQGFAAEVVESTDQVVAEYGLDDDDAEALVSDAHALEGEVSGFGWLDRGGSLPTSFAGLRSPIRLGIQSISPGAVITYTT